MTLLAWRCGIVIWGSYGRNAALDGLVAETKWAFVRFS
jgi:hypothetical protein